MLDRGDGNYSYNQFFPWAIGGISSVVYMEDKQKQQELEKKGQGGDGISGGPHIEQRFVTNVELETTGDNDGDHTGNTGSILGLSKRDFIMAAEGLLTGFFIGSFANSKEGAFQALGTLLSCPGNR
jgi:hypothetical protein